MPESSKCEYQNGTVSKKPVVMIFETNLWPRHGRTIGQFKSLKTSGGTFKGIKREY